MMLMGAEVLFYPTAIGSEPDNSDLDTKDLWQRAMIGHAVSNVVPVVAANRIGVSGQGSRQPVADNASEMGRAKNRRVEIFVAEPAPATKP